MKKYLVGGAVRDKLLGVVCKDRDWVVVGATHEQMMNEGYEAVGAHFGIYIHPFSKEEYAPAVDIRFKDPTRLQAEIIRTPDVTLLQDLKRRDFTINAIAFDDETGEYIDPCNGQRDLEEGILRAVSSDALWYDPCRVLRFARFAARFPHFILDFDTIDWCRNVVAAGKLSEVAPERIWKEISRGLMEAKPSAMFRALRMVNALDVILPELDALWGVPQPEKHHPEVDTGVHVMMVIDKVAEMGGDLDARYASLCHDLGKALTPKEKLPSHHGHEEAGLVPLRTMSKRMLVPSDTLMYAEAVCEHHTKLHNITKLRASTLTDLISQLDVRRRKKMVDLMCITGTADQRGRTGFEESEYPQADYFRAACNGYLGVNAGEAIKNSPPARLAEDLRRARIAGVKKGIREHMQEELAD